MKIIIWVSQHCRYGDFRLAEVAALQRMGPPVIQKAVARTQDCQKLAILDCEDVRTPAELHDIQVWARLVQERSVLVKLVGVCYAEARTLDEVVETVQRRHDPKCLVPKVFPQPGFPEPNLLEPRLLASSSPQPDSSQPDSSEPVEPACKQRRLVDRINRGFTRTWLREEMEDYRSFAWYCDTAGYQASLEQHVENMNSFRFLFEPHYRANLKKPGVEFCILQEFNTHSKEPVWCCVGKVLTRVLKNCRVTSPYLLPRRPILGPTTLDTDASFIMCNLAEVKAGDVVLDPFCGTGSILIAASRLGAVCFGSDLDKRVVRGWGVAYLNRAYAVPESAVSESAVSEPAVSEPAVSESAVPESAVPESAVPESAVPESAVPGSAVPGFAVPESSIYRNFDHYELPRPDIGVMGVDGLSWKKGFVDCLVTDPPYGIRAMAHSDAQTGGLNSVEGLDRLGLTLKNVYAALFRIAGYLLRTKGLLVFLIPSTDEFKVDARSIEIMCGDTFRLDKPIAYQELTGGYGRYCVTVRKI